MDAKTTFTLWPNHYIQTCVCVCVYYKHIYSYIVRFLGGISNTGNSHSITNKKNNWDNGSNLMPYIIKFGFS